MTLYVRCDALMPKPLPSTYPQEQRWRFIQRAFEDNNQLIAFASAISKCHGKRINDCLPELLDFLHLDSGDLKEAWLDLWVTIMHQMGLGYTWDQGRFINVSDLGQFVTDTRNINAYYYYWALKFQYPFATPKHIHYITNNVAVQPIVLILQYLDELYSRDPSQGFLTKYEIAKFLMRSKDHSGIIPNCSSIITNRAGHYDYHLEERSTPGFEEAADHLFSRGKLFIDGFNLIVFDNDQLIIRDSEHIDKIRVFLSFVLKPYIFLENTEDMRNKFFSEVFCDLNPDPTDLYESVTTTTVTTPVRGMPIPPGAPGTRIITNPTDTTGTFTPRMGTQRNFQKKLRDDLLQMYNSQCCICGINLPELLITSHIVPAQTDPSIAADRRNCLLLCALHDRAFEKGFIGLRDDYTIIVNSDYIRLFTHVLLAQELTSRNGQMINLPEETSLRPLIGYIQRHRRLNNIRI